jgi:hypothetical protein
LVHANLVTRKHFPSVVCQKRSRLSLNSLHPLFDESLILFTVKGIWALKAEVTKPQEEVVGLV